jgi:RHS repeat-associated protein
VGNRLTRVIGTTTDTYAYSPTANRIGTITTGSNVRTFGYLASGQVSSDVRDASHSYSFTANDNGRNASAALNSTTAGTYVYNAFEQRVQKTAGGVTTQFVYDRSGHLLEEANASGATQKEYIWLDDMPVAVVDDTGASPVLYFIHADQLGTPQKITDGSMNIVWDGVFDPFGNPVSGGSGSATWGSAQWGSFNWGATGPNLSLTNLRFPGQYFDSETVLNQNWNRDYDPSVGRYIQSDPAGLDGGTNTYSYVDGSVLTDTDPLGLIDNCMFKGNCPAPIKPLTPSQEAEANKELGYLYREVTFIAAFAPTFRACITGAEIVFGRTRIAPFGNRTGNRLGELPHYHRRGVDPATGETIPGQSPSRHRPWETKSPDTSFWDRF